MVFLHSLWVWSSFGFLGILSCRNAPWCLKERCRKLSDSPGIFGHFAEKQKKTNHHKLQDNMVRRNTNSLRIWFCTMPFCCHFREVVGKSHKLQACKKRHTAHFPPSMCHASKIQDTAAINWNPSQRYITSSQFIPSPGIPKLHHPWHLTGWSDPAIQNTRGHLSVLAVWLAAMNGTQQQRGFKCENVIQVLHMVDFSHQHATTICNTDHFSVL